MKYSQLLAELISYDIKKGWKYRKNGDAPVVRELRAFLATRIDANDALIPYADFLTYLEAQWQAALGAEQALAGKSLSQDLIRKFKAAERVAGQNPIVPWALALPPANDYEAATRHNRVQWLFQLPADLWRDVIPAYLDLRSLSRLARTCHSFRNVFQVSAQQGYTQSIGPLLPRLQAELSLRLRLDALIKISDDLRDFRGHVFWSGKPAMEEARALVLSCKDSNPHLNLFYKHGPLRTWGLPPLYLAASRANRELWEWLLQQLLEQAPEAEGNLVSAIAHLQWHATNRELEATQTLLAEHPDLVLASTRSPLITWNSTPLYIAASLQYREVYDLLVSQAPPDYVPVSELMWWVITGRQDADGHYEAANYSEQHGPELMLMSGIDGKSPWQIACAHGDTGLMKALLTKLPEGAYKAALLQQEEVDKNDWHCSPEPFFKAYQAYIDGIPDGIKKANWAALDAAWLRIGDEFRRQPQHRQALYFQAYPLDPLPDFKQVGFQRGCVFGTGANLFPISPAAGPGFEFSVIRSNGRWGGRGTSGWGPADKNPLELALRLGVPTHDLLSHKALYARSQEEYLEINQSLHDKVAQITAAPSPGQS